MLYPATVRPDGDTFVVLFPDIQDTHTNGSSREDAVSHAPSVLLVAGMSMLMEKNRDIPAPGTGRGKQFAMVGLPSLVATARVQINSALRASWCPKVGTGAADGHS